MQTAQATLVSPQGQFVDQGRSGDEDNTLLGLTESNPQASSQASSNTSYHDLPGAAQPNTTPWSGSPFANGASFGPP